MREEIWQSNCRGFIISAIWLCSCEAARLVCVGFDVEILCDRYVGDNYQRCVARARCEVRGATGRQRSGTAVPASPRGLLPDTPCPRMRALYQPSSCLSYPIPCALKEAYITGDTDSVTRKLPSL
ncbi:hypothetical protein O0L34_g8845 [Tuta absoluta]|nr:hypothetical protein O0L34_g8845 [Tuta absoluta]